MALSADGESYVETLPVVGGPIGFIKTFFRILKSPVAEPVRLTQSPVYRGHFGFLTLALAAYAGVAFLVANSGEAEVQAESDLAASLTGTLQPRLLILYGIWAVMTFVLFRFFAPDRQTLKTHVKLWSILTGFFAGLFLLLWIGVAAIAVAVMLAVPSFEAKISAAGPAMGEILSGVLTAVLVFIFTAALSKLWGARWWWSMASLIGGLVLAYPFVKGAFYGLGYVYGLMS